MGVGDKLKKLAGADDTTERSARERAAAASGNLRRRAGAAVDPATRAAAAERARGAVRGTVAAAESAGAPVDGGARGRGATSREKEIARRAEAAATAGPIYDTTLNPTNDPSQLQGFATGAATTEPRDDGSESPSFPAAAALGGSGTDGGLVMDLGGGPAPGSGVGLASSLLYGDASTEQQEADDDPMTWDDSFVNGGF